MSLIDHRTPSPSTTFLSSASPSSRTNNDFEKSADGQIRFIKTESSKTDTQQFCLRWNNYQRNLTNVFDQLLQNESFVDCTLACDGQTIKAHKMVLSACSPYFHRLFSDNPCQHPIIIMKDVNWHDLKASIDFMYKGEINVSQEQIGPLLRIAEMLKIRGLTDINKEQDGSMADLTTIAVKKSKMSPPPVVTGNKMSDDREKSYSPDTKQRKRRWHHTTDSTHLPDPELERLINVGQQQQHERTSPVVTGGKVGAGGHLGSSRDSTPNSQFQLAPTLQAMAMNTISTQINHPDEMEIKPGIAEMIREEERAKLMENSHAWLGGPTTAALADSYQYQLQSMWQKCWSNTNQNLLHNLRFRERGPLKSWRPETMAEAIFSVLKEGLSLSQAARKYDIPYPTFVLYSNRVHNMLGPSLDGATDLRPKGRGRPQRILLGTWPDDHIKDVIKTVVFRDMKELKEEAMNMAYDAQSPLYQLADLQLAFPSDKSLLSNGREAQGASGSTGSPNDTLSQEAAAAMAAVVGLRQQMQLAAAANHQNQVFNIPLHCTSYDTSRGGTAGTNVPMPKLGLPAATRREQSDNYGENNIPMPRHASPAIHDNNQPHGLTDLRGIQHLLPVGLSTSSIFKSHDDELIITPTNPNRSAATNLTHPYKDCDTDTDDVQCLSRPNSHSSVDVSVRENGDQKSSKSIDRLRSPTDDGRKNNDSMHDSVVKVES